MSMDVQWQEHWEWASTPPAGDLLVNPGDGTLSQSFLQYRQILPLSLPAFLSILPEVKGLDLFQPFYSAFSYFNFKNLNDRTKASEEK